MDINAVPDLSAMPKPATAAPPAVGESNQTGNAPRFAREDHTHQSSVQSQRIQVDASGTATWTFLKPYDAIPVVETTAETPSGATYVNVSTVVEGSISKTSCQIQVVRVQKTITLPLLATALLGLVLNLFTTAPTGVYVNCIARKAS